MSTTLIGIDGPLVWAIPSLVLSVPGFLVLLVILAQVGGAAAWLPMVRKKLGRRGGPQSPAR